VSRSSSPPAEGPSPSSAPDGAFLRDLLTTLECGVAVADPDSWEIVFENARFFNWFGPDEDVDAGLNRRLPGFDGDRISARLDKGRAFRYEVESGEGARTVPIEVVLRTCAFGDRELAIAECTDIGKRKEAEYMLDSHTRMVEKYTRDLKREKERAQKLLLNIMPQAVYEEMKDFGSVTPQRYDAATILMLDFVGFTDMAISRDPGSIVSELNDIFSAFDRVVELFNCERMKTIGDAYMAVAGIPEPSSDHAQSIARVALRMRRYLERRNTSHREPWLGRIGIHSGPVVGSIVGVQRYVYDIFGPGVNLASRMEALAEPMEIAITADTHELIRDEFICSERGVQEVKGFGEQAVFSLEGELDSR
jgi:adenylate cyclase